MHAQRGLETENAPCQEACQEGQNMLAWQMRRVRHALEDGEAGDMGKGAQVRMQIEAPRHVLMYEPCSMQGVDNIRK